MNPTLKLSGLTLRVRNLEAQLAFYRDLLRMQAVSQEGNRTDLALSGGEFTLLS